MSPVPTSDWNLSLKDAAWLARVNDSTVSRWVPSPERDPDGRISWRLLDDYCARHRRPRPLHPDWLALTAEHPRPDFLTSGTADPFDLGQRGRDRHLEREIHRLEQQVANLAELLVQVRRHEADEAALWADAVTAQGVPPAPNMD